MEDLLAKLDDIARLSRVSAVDAATQGSPFYGSNFKGKWQGFSEYGNGIVEYQGQQYIAKTLALKYTQLNKAVYMRVGRGFRTVNY